MAPEGFRRPLWAVSAICSLSWIYRQTSPAGIVDALEGGAERLRGVPYWLVA
ncbi:MULTISPECIES: hypothetical protein [Neisseriaceae]|uniref:Uncharacterized protein n=1 Tax=Neisseria mucosa (strain ATCC 25996 / DSM 4631 / NCTC 10774 / M26) TaxID=546266 RepID=D3A0T2_NEIM2|nr:MULTISPECIES: hypothetical protein [Neisseriaceae]EFC87065.1 hypothetical protein NEIMUCOT_06523 [Neisseria mucosa ATCC 25996]MBS5837081.1 hypothetical protein [Neisseria sp.]MBS6045083.1 hypothetical protein [Neisseria sp.]MDU4438104.1 hypothetical protein [Neisseria sp.]